MATTLLTTPVDSRRAAAAQRILANLGLDATSAVNMFLAQVVARRGIPFPVQEEGYAYAAAEYGLAPAEVDAAEKRVVRRIRRAAARKEVRAVPEDFAAFRRQL